MRMILKLSILSAMVWMTGCSSSYVTPGRGVEMEQVLGDGWKIDRPKPTATFPARVAVARLQESGYRNYRVASYGTGRFSVVTTRDVETDEDFESLAKLPQLAGLAMLNRLILPVNLNTDRDLRDAAGKLRADMLLIYSFDTSFNVKDHEIGPLGLLSLGTIPNQEARVSSTCSAALLDVNTGYIYGLAEASGEQRQLSSFWGSEKAVDSARVKAEQKAFAALVPELQKMWSGVVREYAVAR